MWATLAFAAALGLAPDQTGPLQLTNARATYGFLGATRPDNKLLPGDVYFVTYDIENITVKNGKALYKMSMEFLNSKGKAEFKRDPEDLESTLSLGGTRMPGMASAEVGTETAPGEYTLKVEVTDRSTNKSETLVRKFEVLPKAFGLVQLTLSADPQGKVPAGALGVGQSLYVNSHVVGFQRGPAGQPNVALELRVLDEGGKPTLASPLTGRIDKGVPPKDPVLPGEFLVSLNRPGKFTVELKATDEVANKSVTQSFPITVHETK